MADSIKIATKEVLYAYALDKKFNGKTVEFIVYKDGKIEVYTKKKHEDTELYTTVTPYDMSEKYWHYKPIEFSTSLYTSKSLAPLVTFKKIGGRDGIEFTVFRFRKGLAGESTTMWI